MVIEAGGVPHTVDFGKVTSGPDLFWASICTLVWWSGLFELLLVAVLWATLPWWLGRSLPAGIWRYETSNHHFLLNLLAKAGLDFWQWSTGAEDWEFDETALRLLPFLCALAGLLAWALFFHHLGFGVAAAILPWMLALHPWYQRHATGMRGYPLVFLFLPLTLLCAVRALRRGRWRAWLGFAVCRLPVPVHV